MIPLLVGIALFVAGFAGLWRLHVRGRRPREDRRSADARAAATAVARYLAEGLAWVACLVLVVVGGAVTLWAYEALRMH